MNLHKPIVPLMLCLLISGGCEGPDDGIETDNNNTRPDEIVFIKTPAIESDANTSIIATRKDASVEISYRYFDPAILYKIPSLDVPPDLYEVYLSADSGNTWEMIRTIEASGDEGSFTIDGLVNHELYYIYVKEKALLTGKTENSNVALFVPSPFKPMYNFIAEDHYGNDLYSFGVNGNNNNIVYATRYFEYEPGYAAASVFLAGSVGNPELIGTSCYFPDFSGDGSQIAYSSDKGEVFDGILMPEHLFIYDVNTATANRVTSGYSVNKYPARSTDNAKLAFSSSPLSDQALRISVYDTEDKTIQKVSEITGLPGDVLSYSQERPAWSADGKYIYYS
ncbi:MAG: PD40 domain-containing protein, partial [Bacteroidales bacterium]|nr:PD40 domain-containing protein [Bacteroidales bacterium]